jgi:Predicted Fe-S oxidoreductases
MENSFSEKIDNGNERVQDKEAIARQWRKYLDENGVPNALVIEPSTRCDWSRCPACYACSEPGIGQDMATETMKDIRDVVLESGSSTNQVWVAGGEPTGCEELPEIINAVAEMTGEVCLVTNGLNLANEEFARNLIEKSRLAEIAITLNSGNRDVHNMMVTEDDHELWSKLPDGGVAHLAKTALNGELTRSENNNAFDHVLKAISNVTKLKNELGKDYRVAVNLNTQGLADLEDLVGKVEGAGGYLDLVIFQSFQRAGRGVNSHSRSFEWQEPTEEMVRTYLEAARKLIDDGRIGDAVWIDPVSKEIERALGLGDEPMYEQAEATPCFGPDGVLRDNVVS